jgi:hypothetical protein
MPAIPISSVIRSPISGMREGWLLAPSFVFGDIGTAPLGRHSDRTRERKATSPRRFSEAIDRAHNFVDAGADVTFVEAPENLEELTQITKSISVPQVANIVFGGKPRRSTSGCL